MIHNILVHWLRLARPARLIFAIGAWAVIASLGVLAIQSHSRPATTPSSTPTAASAPIARTNEAIYSVAQVLSGIHQHPKAWEGRSILVRGYIGQEDYTRTGLMLDRVASTPVELFAARPVGLAPWPTPEPGPESGSMPPMAPGSLVTVQAFIYGASACGTGPCGYGMVGSFPH